jgi:uncharacterized protein with PhoU and TrkA domain
VLILALRNADGSWLTNPPPETEIAPGQVLIAIGTSDQISRLAAASGSEG